MRIRDDLVDWDISLNTFLTLILRNNFPPYYRVVWPLFVEISSVYGRQLSGYTIFQLNFELFCEMNVNYITFKVNFENIIFEEG